MKRIRTTVADNFLNLSAVLHSLSDKAGKYGVNLHLKFRTKKGLKIAQKMKAVEKAMLEAAEMNKLQTMKEYELKEKNRLKAMLKSPSKEDKGEN